MARSQIHIGDLIRIELTRQKHTVAWFADELRIKRPNCYRILRARSIDTAKLFAVSQILHHDFFAEYSKGLDF